ncbi:hypothetical protein CS542_02580 [Pedobacter sp. IW39]|nr:hypothetical protein CS542_02580 [Pedobacter sp. IW39]
MMNLFLHWMFCTGQVLNLLRRLQAGNGLTYLHFSILLLNICQMNDCIIKENRGRSYPDIYEHQTATTRKTNRSNPELSLVR